MDVPTGSPVEGLQGLRKFLPNPAILVSRPSSSSPSLSMLPDSPSKLGVVRSEGVDAMTQSFGDVGGLAAAGLVAQAVDQEVLEQEIAVKAEKAIIEKEDERDQKRLDKTNTEKEKLVATLQRFQEQLRSPRTTVSKKQELQTAIAELQPLIDGLNRDIEQITARIAGRSKTAADLNGLEILAPGERRSDETERNYLIRTGKITPFSQIPGAERSNLNINGVSGPFIPFSAMSHQNLRRPGFQQAEIPIEESSGEEGEVRLRKQHCSPKRVSTTIDFSIDEEDEMPPLKRRRVKGSEVEPVNITSDSEPTSESATSSKGRSKVKTESASDGDYEPERKKMSQKGKEKGKRRAVKVEDGFTPADARSEDMGDDDDFFSGREEAMVKSKKRKGKGVAKAIEAMDTRRFDDGNEESYLARVGEWIRARKEAREKHKPQNESEEEEEEELDEWFMPHPTELDTVFNGGLRIPGDIFPSLFDYQKVGVQWLWELHSQNAGGIIGDEMGLGKTIQIISFVAGLHHSGLLTKPVLIVAPATVLKQWVNEFHVWWPPLRVSILHSSGSGMLNVQQEEDVDDLLENGKNIKRSRNQTAARKVVGKVFEKGHVLVTSYAGLKSYEELLLDKEWNYAILDEGHKIRNPDADISITCKKLKTHHRIILSGTPLQNNLIELWSLFDFVFPGRLGILPIFKAQIEVPIRIGGYAGATNVQVMTAQHCSEVLKELMGPYLIRRVKIDVAADLPKKSEQVLFCKLTIPQSEAYQMFLNSQEMREVFDGKRNRLFAIDALRKICNHPDLADRVHLKNIRDYNYGSGALSGKMQITKSLLQMWKSQGHKTLLFAQTRQMLDILEGYVKNLPDGFQYRRMDGNTAIQRRQEMVDEFNNDESIDVFLLTTKVGGLGVNLTGADRVIIYDPDWNPSTDMQARERAWRLGQKRPVTIYRLLTAGTIEEKIYHRQIFKQHLALKVLTDASQRLFFRSDDLHDLFSLGGSAFAGTETGTMFAGAEKVYTPTTGPEDSPATRNEDDPLALHSIAGLAGLENLTDAETATDTKNDEQRLMASLFAGTGVVSALEHDAVMNASSTSKNPLERQAIKVAQAAAKALKESIKVTQGARIGTVTWTGRKGDAGREGDEGPPVVKTAAGLLATLRRANRKPGMPVGDTGSGGRNILGSEPMLRAASGNRSGNGVTIGGGSRTVSPLGGGGSFVGLRVRSSDVVVKLATPRRSPVPEPRVSRLITGLREFMKKKGGKALSTEISAFGRSVVDEKDETQMAEFRHSIKEIAVFKKADRVWELKKEFL